MTLMNWFGGNLILFWDAKFKIKEGVVFSHFLWDFQIRLFWQNHGGFVNDLKSGKGFWFH